VHAHRRGVGAAWRRGGRDRARPRHRPLDNLFARARALLNRAAALLRFLHPWPASAIIRAGVCLRSRDQLHGPGRIFPSDLAIDGMVRIDQLGASLWEVAHDWRGLWALVSSTSRSR